MPRRLPLALVLAVVPLVADAAPIRLVPHKVVYDLALASSRGARGVESARGRIAFDFTGDACEGYALKFRQVTVLEGGESGTRISDLRTANFESGDGRSFRFRNDSTFDPGATKTVDGQAEKKGGGGPLALRLRTPKREAVSLDGGAIFPNAHMREIIAAAQAGTRTLSVKVFDGSDDGKKVYDTLSVIGPQLPAGASDAVEEPARQARLAGLVRWPVTISYFAPGRGEQEPVYVLSFELYENGISRALKLDYGDFALRGQISQLELLPESACPR